MKTHIQAQSSRLFLLSSFAATMVLFPPSVIAAATLQTVNLKTQHEVDPLGIDITQNGPPDGYTWCAAENASYTLDGTCDVAFGANGSYRYLHGKTGSITFNLATFGGDPAPGVVKAGYYKSGKAGDKAPKREPVFSWQLSTTGTNVLQTAYQVVVSFSSGDAASGRGDVWDSGKISSAQSLDIVYNGPDLVSMKRYYWSVKVWDNQGNVSAWAPAACWEMGLLAPDDWSGAQWINGNSTVSPLLRKEFTVSKKVARARLYVSAAGYYEASLNGRRVGDAVLDPGFTAYNKRVLYATHDVTSQIRSGANAIGVTLGRGFYAIDQAGVMWFGGAPWWTHKPRALVKLDVTFTDNTHEIVVSGADWLAKDGPTTFDSLFKGEIHDARQSPASWNAAGYDTAGWAKAAVTTAPAVLVKAQMAEPMRVVDTLTATSITQPQLGKYVFKFPVMTAGWFKLSVTGKAGTTVTLRLGESLHADGTVNNQGDPGLTPGEIQKYQYILSGKGSEVWEPRFSYAGFQYIQVEGFPGTPTTSSVVARVVHSDLATTGTFTSSDPLINSIHDICRRTVLNNVHSVPTDCPMFEKRAWTGDASLFTAQGVDNFDMQRFLTKWLNDLSDNQGADGAIGDCAPSINSGAQDPSWPSAYLVVAWRVYQEYGDLNVIDQHYDAMKRFVDYWTSRSRGYLIRGLSYYGDWVSPNFVQPPEGPDITASGDYYRDVVLLAHMACLTAKTADAAAYSALANHIKDAFNAAFLANGVYAVKASAGYRQTSNAVPLFLGITPNEQVGAVVNNLVADIQAKGNHLNTGSIGTAALLPALTVNGKIDVACEIATQTTFPSWGNWIANGATTCWEQWITGAGLRSRNHAFLGTIDDWFYKYLAGIQPAAPGYKQINIRPYVPAKLSSVSASMSTPMGPVSSAWKRNADRSVTLNVTIPANSTANIWIPGRTAPIQVGSGSYTYTGSTDRK
ncbi:MAG: family 78 glycoside hydrolase catalytic domain [Kiritimatiellaeota bacterium]|nr:family 78 glycoside hydrolase catalytic domain [Kiritimatiellota bacterium]